jgi:hypothetical protein
MDNKRDLAIEVVILHTLHEVPTPPSSWPWTDWRPRDLYDTVSGRHPMSADVFCAAVSRLALKGQIETRGKYYPCPYTTPREIQGRRLDGTFMPRPYWDTVPWRGISAGFKKFRRNLP